MLLSHSLLLSLTLFKAWAQGRTALSTADRKQVSIIHLKSLKLVAVFTIVNDTALLNTTAETSAIVESVVGRHICRKNLVNYLNVDATMVIGLLCGTSDRLCLY